MMDIREILLWLRAGESNRAIEQETGIDRRTVKKYRRWATKQGLLEQEKLPPTEGLQSLLEKRLGPVPPPQNVSPVEPYRAVVGKLREEGVEIAAIRERLKERGFEGSY